MSYNPYESPGDPSKSATGDEARSMAASPAIALMIVSCIFIGGLLISQVFNVILLASGLAGRMEQPQIGMSKETQVAIRMCFGVILIVLNVCILLGAIKMKQLRNYSLARAAAIMSVIPCIAPCYFLGIPFGIWALVVLNKPEVKKAFR